MSKFHIRRFTLVLIAFCFLWVAEALAQATCTGVPVSAGSTDVQVQAILNANPTGTTFCFAPTVPGMPNTIYRFAGPITPKTGQKLISAQSPGAVLDGSLPVSSSIFTPSGNAWVASGLIKASQDTSPCLGGPTNLNCQIQQDMFMDDKPLIRVTSLAQVGPGKYFQDPTANKTYLGDNPTGHNVEVANASSIIFTTASNNVTVQGFVIKKAANTSEFGAINAYLQTGWTVDGNQVWGNHGTGILVDNALIQNNYVHHNGQFGLEGACTPLPPPGSGCYLNSATNPNRIYYNEIAFNNTDGFSPQFGAGGAKWAATQGMIVKGNYIHDNKGPGAWCDINCYNTTFQYNTIINNMQPESAPGLGDGLGGGIIYEISDKANISYNTLLNNDPPPAQNYGLYYADAVQVAESPNVEVSHNIVVGLNGLGMTQWARSDSCIANTYPDRTPMCPGGYHSTHDTNFHDNIMTETGSGQVAGLFQNQSDLSYYTSKNNLYVNDHYVLPDPVNGAYFYWNCPNSITDNCPNLTFSNWQSNNQDNTGNVTAPAH